MENRNATVTQDIGIELEFSDVSRNNSTLVNTIKYRLGSRFRIVHDASCEAPKVTLANLQIVGKDNNKYLSCIGNIVEQGGEIVSPVVYSPTTRELSDLVYSLTGILKDNGENEQSLVDSFHVHVIPSLEILN